MAEALDRGLQTAAPRLNAIVQVNTSNESSKVGLHPIDVPGFVERMQHYTVLKLRGLMTLSVVSPQSDGVRRCFTLLCDLRNDCCTTTRRYRLQELLMGTSGDFAIAIKEARPSCL